MLLLTAMALGADPPTSKDEVHTLLAQLLAERAETRIEAATALAKTPPELLVHIEATAIDPACAASIGERELDALSPRCQRWNHAMYHYIRFVEVLARKSIDPETPFGAWCLPRTQPHAGARVEAPACPMPGRLRWMVNDPFDHPELIDLADHDAPPFTLPEALSASTLLRDAREAYRRALTPDIPDASTLAKYPSWSARDGARSVYLVPICGGMAGFYESCASHLVVVDSAGLRQVALMPPTELGGPPDRGAPYANLRMAHAVRLFARGDHAIVVTDGGCCDDRTRRYDVFDVSAEPRLHCEVEVQLDEVETAPPPTLPTITATGCTL